METPSSVQMLSTLLIAFDCMIHTRPERERQEDYGIHPSQDSTVTYLLHGAATALGLQTCHGSSQSRHTSSVLHTGDHTHAPTRGLR